MRSRRCSCGIRNIGPAQLVNYVSFRSARSGLRMEANFEKLRPRAKCHVEFEFEVSWDATGSGGALEHLSKVETPGPCAVGDAVVE